jgi:hypothetical protein
VAAAVANFIEGKVSQLAEQKRYSEGLCSNVLRWLTLDANHTILRTALVCEELQTTSTWKVLKKLESFPPGLESLYRRMMQQTSDSDNDEVCKWILATLALVHWRLALEERAMLTKQLHDTSKDLDMVHKVIGCCGSFLTIRGRMVYFVHQSTQDFVLTKATKLIFLSGRKTSITQFSPNHSKPCQELYVETCTI